MEIMDHLSLVIIGLSTVSLIGGFSVVALNGGYSK